MIPIYPSLCRLNRLGELLPLLRCLPSLESLGIVKEVTGKDRHKTFVYKEHLDIP